MFGSAHSDPKRGQIRTHGAKRRLWGSHMFVFQTENQNRSYMVRSTASFSVIEMPYKNLQSELPSNSTAVRHTHTHPHGPIYSSLKMPFLWWECRSLKFHFLLSTSTVLQWLLFHLVFTFVNFSSSLCSIGWIYCTCSFRNNRNNSGSHLCGNRE